MYYLRFISIVSKSLVGYRRRSVEEWTPRDTTLYVNPGLLSPSHTESMPLFFVKEFLQHLYSFVATNKLGAFQRIKSLPLTGRSHDTFTRDPRLAHTLAPHGNNVLLSNSRAMVLSREGNTSVVGS